MTDLGSGSPFRLGPGWLGVWKPGLLFAPVGLAGLAASGQVTGYPSVPSYAPALFPSIEPKPLPAHVVDICVLQLGKVGQC